MMLAKGFIRNQWLSLSIQDTFNNSGTNLAFERGARNVPAARCMPKASETGHTWHCCRAWRGILCGNAQAVEHKKLHKVIHVHPLQKLQLRRVHDMQRKVCKERLAAMHNLVNLQTVYLRFAIVILQWLAFRSSPPRKIYCSSYGRMLYTCQVVPCR